MKLGQYPFTYVTVIEPDRVEMGKIKRLMPQSLYKNVRRLPLHEYGLDSFCRFRIIGDIPFAGVYALLSNEAVHYIGECRNLSARFNNGYGQISPRNCYRGGQSTNCRINRLILETAEGGNQIDLWFFKTETRKSVQNELISEFQPPWNIQGMS